MLKRRVAPRPTGRGPVAALLTKAVTRIVLARIGIKRQLPPSRAPQLPRLLTELVRIAAVRTVGAMVRALVSAAGATPRAVRFTALMRQLAPRQPVPP